jgi:ribosome-associated protein
MNRLTTPAGVELDPSGVETTTSTSGGKGGQHANRAETRVTVVVRLTEALPAELAGRAVQKVGATIRVSCAETRSQLRNREIALTEALRRVDAALVEQQPRRATKIPRSSVRARRAEKEHRSRRLAERRSRGEE